jgi:hypothetical protein
MAAQVLLPRKQLLEIEQLEDQLRLKKAEAASKQQQQKNAAGKKKQREAREAEVSSSII